MVSQVKLTVFLLTLLTVVLLFIVGKKKSIRFIIALFFTIVILLSVITPLIMKGYNPVWVTFIGSVPITILIIYITEGFKKLSHLSIGATLLIFLITSLLADGAVILAHFSGIVSDVSTTVGGQLGIDLPKLLVAGIMLSTLGILIEMVVTQVATVIELVEANSMADEKQILKQSFNVGIIHLGSIINTLFLIYAGVSLPLLIVFLDGQSSLANILGYEPVSSEIIRILVSTIGLIIAMPITTLLAIHFLIGKHKKSN